MVIRSSRPPREDAAARTAPLPLDGLRGRSGVPAPPTGEVAYATREEALRAAERDLAGRAEALAARERHVTAREAALAVAAAELAEREADLARLVEGGPHLFAVEPTAWPESASDLTFAELEARVLERSPEFPDRAHEWACYLFCLREQAEADGRLPDAFAWLVEDVFAPALADPPEPLGRQAGRAAE